MYLINSKTEIKNPPDFKVCIHTKHNIKKHAKNNEP